MSDKAELVAELQRVYAHYQKPFTRREYRAVGFVASRTIEKTFGSWSNALKAAKVKDTSTAPKAVKVKEAVVKTPKVDKAAVLREQVQKDKEDFNVEKDLKDKWDSEKKDLLDKAERAELKHFRIKAHKLDLLGEMVHSAATLVEKPTIVVHPKEPKKLSKKDPCSLWFEFSDLQLGTKMTLEEMGGLNEHNWKIWQGKLEIWKCNVIKKISTYEEERAIDRVVIACLGDMVEGQDIFAGQQWQIDRPVVDQALLGSEDVFKAFAEIFLTFPHVEFHVLEVFGNHGRIGRKGENPYSNSMDKVFQRFLQMRLQTIPLKNMTYHQNEAWFFFTAMYGWNHLLLHGDQGMSSLWSNRPTVNGLEKGVVRYNQMLQQQVHFVHCGHFHNDWQLSMNMSQLLINGSFIGTSNFSAAKMVASSPPVQTMHVFEPRVGLERTERIHLVSGDVRNPIDPHALG